MAAIFEKIFPWRRSPRRRSADQMDAFASELGTGLHFRGSLHGRGSYHVLGEVVGEGEIEGALVLAAGAYWNGRISADYVRVAGKIDGDVSARVKIELTATAVVTGDLSSPVIAIADGAIYEGEISRPRKTQVMRHSERRGQGDLSLPA